MAVGPSRLMRWMLPHEQPKHLPIEHPVQEDIAWAADEIERLRGLLNRERIADIVAHCDDHHPTLCTKDYGLHVADEILNEEPENG